MSFGVGGTGGFAVVATQPVAQLDYDPVVGACVEQDGRLFYEVLPDPYLLLEDYSLLPEIWQGYLQVAADLYLQLMVADAAQYLLEVPLDFQRKYQHIDLDFVADFAVDPELTEAGASVYAYSPVDDRVDGVWETKTTLDRAYVPLRSRLDQRASLRWSWRAGYSQLDEGAYSFVGYFDSAKTSLRGCLLVGVGDGGKIAVAQFSPAGNVNLGVSIPVVPLDTDVDISVVYEASTQRVSVDVTRVSDSSALLDGFSFLLPNGAAAETFSADAFGMVNLQVRLPGSPAFPALLGRRAAGYVSALAYLDPTLPEIIQDVPFLQDVWCAPSIFWTRGVEFAFQDSHLAFSDITAVPAFLLAEYVSYDLGLIRDNFGLDVGLVGPNVEAYQSQVRALHYSFWKGPTVASVRLGVQVLLNLPFSVEEGEVTSINPSLSGTRGQIVVVGAAGPRSYTYPKVVSPTVVVGQHVDAFQPLTDGVRVVDWRNDPTWFLPYLDDTSPGAAAGIFAAALGTRNPALTPRNEVQKFHSFGVVVDADTFAFDDLPSIRHFVERIKQTWKQFILILERTLVDEVAIDDPLAIDIIVRLSDRGGAKDLTAPAYGDDYQYGQNDPPIYYGMYRDLFPDDPIEVTMTNISGSDKTILVNGSPVLVTAGNDVVEDIP